MHHQQIIKLIKLVIQASVCAYLSMVAGVMMRRPRGVAVERVLPQRVPGRRQVQLQVAAVRHNLEAATTTSGAGVCHLCRCRRRVLLVCKCRTGMEPPLYDGHAVLCYKQEAAACAVDALCLDGTMGLLFMANLRVRRLGKTRAFFFPIFAAWSQLGKSRQFIMKKFCFIFTR